MSILSDSHDIHCGCEVPFSHLLDSIFPKGHADRNKSIEQIITRDCKAWLSGGGEEESGGIELGESAATLADKLEEKDLPENDGDVEELLAAVEDAEQR